MTNELCIGLLLLLCLHLSGQSDTLVVAELPEVILKNEKLSHPGQNALFASNKDLRQVLQVSSTLAELLSFQTTSIIRDRGNNSLATLSVRGGSSQQTQVLWNGANINNGMLGLSDLSTISPLFMEKIELKPVQKDMSYQPIGGVLNLSNSSIDSQYFDLGVLAGQHGFQQYHLRAAHRWSTKTEVRFKGLYNENNQNFPYLEEHQSVLLPDRQPHADQTQIGAMVEVIQDIGSNHKLELRSWIHAMRRELPPSIQQRRSTAIQRDSFQRHQFIWKYEGKAYQHVFNYTHRREVNHFEDPLNAQDSHNPFRAHQLISQHRYTIHPHLWFSGGANIQHQSFNTENYADREQFTEGELFFGAHAFSLNKKHRIEAQIRQGWRSEQWAPITGQIAWTHLQNNHNFGLEFSRSYRFPSANDLFWSPFGNPQLEPESSNQIQGQYTFKKNMFFFNQLRFATYFKQVDDWILWAPLNDNFFRPYNILEVTAAGLETSLQKSFSWSPRITSSFRLLYNYQYVRNTGPLDSPVAQKGENLIYMPEHQWAAYVSTSWRGLSLLYQHEFQSHLFTQADLQVRLPARNIAHLTLSYSRTIQSQDIQVFLKVHNIWNESYFFQPFFPAPGRFLRWGIFYKPKF